MELGEIDSPQRMNPHLPSGAEAADSKPFYWIGDFPEPPALLKTLLERNLKCPVASLGRRIPARWSPVHRQLAYFGLAVSILRHRKKYRGGFSVQQFIGLYACYFSARLRIPLPPMFLQPLIYVPRKGVFGWMWRHLFATALGHPSLRIAFCHSQREIDEYRLVFPAAAAKFRLLRFAIDPVPPPAAPASPPYLFSAGMSCRDYATLFEAARRLPAEFPFIRIACKPADVQDLVPPPNVLLQYDLWGEPFREALARATLVVVPLRPLPISAGQTVCLTAMSAARPIVATRTPASSEFLDDACAWLVPPEDPDALAAAIQEAVNNPDLARAKADAARARFNAVHSPKAIFQQSTSAIAAELR